MKHALWSFNGSPAALVMAAFPDHKWLPWMFDSAPKHMWENSQNIRAYFEWLGKVLGYNSLEDWYTISVTTIKNNYGTQGAHKCNS